MNNKVVYVTMKAAPFQHEQMMDIYSTAKAAEKALREKFPYMRADNTSNSKNKSFVSDASNTLLLFIVEKEVL